MWSSPDQIFNFILKYFSDLWWRYFNWNCSAVCKHRHINQHINKTERQTIFGYHFERINGHPQKTVLKAINFRAIHPSKSEIDRERVYFNLRGRFFILMARQAQIIPPSNDKWRFLGNWAPLDGISNKLWS